MQERHKLRRLTKLPKISNGYIPQLSAPPQVVTIFGLTRSYVVLCHSEFQDHGCRFAFPHGSWAPVAMVCTPPSAFIRESS